EHPLYGELRGPLMVRTHEDVANYMTRIRVSGAEPLSHLTHGVHFHNLGAPDEATLQKIAEALRQKGFLLEGDEGR
ncbi:MAG: 3H domain-containing protein, partial [Anaerolineae bacterium]